MFTESDCTGACADLDASGRSCVNAASSCSAVEICLSSPTTMTSPDGGGGVTKDAGGGVTKDAGGGDDDDDTTPGTCTGVLSSGETCPSPCSISLIDGREQCTLSCQGDSDCRGDYSKCGYGNVCAPPCASDGDCTAFGFNFCAMTSGYCE